MGVALRIFKDSFVVRQRNADGVDPANDVALLIESDINTDETFISLMKS